MFKISMKTVDVDIIGLVSKGDRIDETHSKFSCFISGPAGIFIQQILGYKKGVPQY